MSKTLRTGQVAFPLPVSRTSEVITSTNTVMLRLKERLNELEIPDFGSSLYAGDSNHCVFNNTDTIIASLITDRIINKFEVPSRNTESLLKRQCFSDWIGYERDHLERVNLSNLSIKEREPIWGASRAIYRWMAGYSNGRYFYDRSFNSYVENAPIEFGPGESFISSKGHVHLFGKLDPKTITVTSDAAEFAALIVASNKGLRKVFTEEFRKQPRAISKGEQLKAYKQAQLQEGKTSLKVRVFANRVLDFWRKNALIQYGSRGSSVYKNSKKRRFINIECLMNVVMQKMIAYAFRNCLKANAGIDLDLGQDYHKALIRSNDVATIDFSNASDSILVQLVRTLFWQCPQILAYMETTRSSFVLIPTPNGNGQMRNMYHDPLKFSSMGNGYTFELLTMVTASVARYFDSTASSYGDDVIIQNEYAEMYAKTMVNLGFQVNNKKTFINKPFRESCGGFYLGNYGYITSYDFKWNHNIADVIVTANKLGRILRSNPTWKHKVRDVIQEAYEDIDDLIPRALRGPVIDGPDIPVWFEKSNYLRGHRKDEYVKLKFITYRRYIDALSIAYRGPEKEYDSCNWTVILVPELKKNVAVNPKRDVRSLRLAYAYIYSGRVAPMLIRQQKSDYKFAFKPTLVHSSGVALRAATARRIETDLKKSYHSEFICKLKSLLEKQNESACADLRGAV